MVRRVLLMLRVLVCSVASVTFALGLPSAARAADTGTYVLTNGIPQLHAMGLGNNFHVASFRARAGMSYRVQVTTLGMTEWSSINVILRAVDGTAIDGTYVMNTTGGVYGKSAADGTMTVQLTGSWMGATPPSYRITTDEFEPMTIEGTTRDLVTGEPLPGMTVDLFRQPVGSFPDHEQAVSSDAQGHYSFSIEVPHGFDESWEPIYIVGFTDPSGAREGEFDGGQQNWANATHFAFSSGAIHTDVDGRLGLPWAIDAIVRSGDGGPAVPGAVIQVYQRNACDWWVPGETLVADDQGHFTLARSARTVTRVKVHDPSGMIPDQFIGGGFDVWDAADVQMQSGMTSTAPIILHSGAQVVGRVMDGTTGKPVAGAIVQAWRATQRDGWVQARNAATGPDGAYVLRTVPGSYRLCVVDPSGLHAPRWNSGAVTQDSAPDVLTSESTVTVVDFLASPDLVPPTTSASGTVGWSRGPVTVALIAGDDGDGVAHTYYSVGDDTTAHLYSGPLLFATEGRTRLRFWSTDFAGNVEPQQTTWVQIDRGRPGVVDDACSVYETSAVIRMAMADLLSGSDHLVYRVDATPWKTAAGSMTTLTVTTPGRHVLEYVGVDVAGNESTCAVAAFTIGSASTACSLMPVARVAAYGSTVPLSGRIAVTPGVPARYPVMIESSTDGRVFSPTGQSGATGDDGSFDATVRAVRNCWIRVVCIGTPGVAGSTSRPVRLLAKAALTTPTAPKSVHAYHVFTIAGMLSPGHVGGSRVVSIRCYRSEHGRWVLRKTIAARTSTGASSSRFSARLGLSRGWWRLVARHADASHATTDSGYRTILVR
jgi:hypothetical protein